MQTVLVIGCLLLLAEPNGQPASELEPPRQINAHDVPIDILREGQASPAYGDIDGDGLPELLVGEAFGGRLRVYRNRGTRQNPVFGDYAWLRVGEEVARVPCARGGYKGFSPQLVDLDGDGKIDILSGSYNSSANWTNELYWFRQQEPGKFASPIKLTDVKGMPLEFRGGAIPSCADWDGDGDIDLVLGTLDGRVLLLTNEGTRTKPEFADPVPLAAEEGPISIPSGWVHPCLTDWDGDKLTDLLVSALDGSVLLYKNYGTAREPQLGRPETLVGVSPVTTQPDNRRPQGKSGMQPAICVADYNGDGLLDLILGDSCGTFHGPPLQHPHEALQAEQNRANVKAARTRWADVFQTYRNRGAESATASPTLSGTPSADEGATLRAELERLSNQIEALQGEQAYDLPRYHRHGFVWVFLRRSQTGR